MSSRLGQEISKLVAEARQERIDHDTMVVGYAYLAESHPQCGNQVRQHLEAFVDLACTRGHQELCERSSKIIKMFDGNDMTDAA